MSHIASIPAEHQDMTDIDKDMEELVLKESIVSATGLSAGEVLIGIKGDPSMRETALERPRYRNRMDEIYPDIVESLTDLLQNRSSYRLYVGFNSVEVRTSSVFDPLREETHSAEKFLDPGYLERHFPVISYEDKIEGIREIYRYLRASPLFDKLPGYWRNISLRRAGTWQPMDGDGIPHIMQTLKILRDMPGYYLRGASISIVQDLVRMQFNCDGTQLVRASNYKRFLEENIPA